MFFRDDTRVARFEKSSNHAICVVKNPGRETFKIQRVAWFQLCLQQTLGLTLKLWGVFRDRLLVDKNRT